jgi:hypothetical protein
MLLLSMSNIIIKYEQYYDSIKVDQRLICIRTKQTQ